MTDTKPIEPSVEALRECVRFGGLRKVASYVEITQALAAYDQLKAENEALKAQPIPIAVLDQIANMQGEIDTLRSDLTREINHVKEARWIVTSLKNVQDLEENEWPKVIARRDKFIKETQNV